MTRQTPSGKRRCSFPMSQRWEEKKCHLISLTAVSGCGSFLCFSCSCSLTQTQDSLWDVGKFYRQNWVPLYSGAALFRMLPHLPAAGLLWAVFVSQVRKRRLLLELQPPPPPDCGDRPPSGTRNRERKYTPHSPFSSFCSPAEVTAFVSFHRFWQLFILYFSPGLVLWY
jgi:hypothetical protein